MFTTLSFKFKNNNNIKEICKNLENALETLGECGTLSDNIEIKENQIITSGIPIIDENDTDSMFNEMYPLLFVDFILKNFPKETFSVYMNIKGFSISVINVIDGESVGFYHYPFENKPEELEYVYFIGEEHDYDDDDWEPVYYDDFEEFVNDYYLTFSEKDMSFFNDTEFTSLFSNVDWKKVKKDNEEFNDFLTMLENKKE